MATLTPEQEQRLTDLAEQGADRAAHRRRQLDAGDVVDHAVPSAYKGVAEGERTVGIAAVYESDIPTARERFRAATSAYREGIGAAVSANPWATAHRQVPETCQEALFTAMVADDVTAVRELATMVQDLPVPDSFTDGGFHPGQYYLARMLADAVEETFQTSTREAVADHFADAPDPIALYADGVTELAHGIATNDAVAVEGAIETLLDYHDADRHPDNVVDAVMAVEATGAAWLAHHYGLDPAIDDGLIPEGLVTG